VRPSIDHDESSTIRTRGARVPALFVYSVNDRFFGPDLAKRMHEAYVRSGGNAEFVAAPATGLDGHGYFARRMDDWSPRVEAFLKKVVSAP
jgi:pimeloyl-ACP methyl ester carboxylesterase